MKYQLRCIQTYETCIPAGPMIDQNGNTLCSLPEHRVSNPVGKIAVFSNKAKLKTFLAHPLNAGKWESCD